MYVCCLLLGARATSCVLFVFDINALLLIEFFLIFSLKFIYFLKKSCVECNRTYYGNLGVTYHMELHRPKEEKTPFVCQLTFTAGSGSHGDIVQVTIITLLS